MWTGRYISYEAQQICEHKDRVLFFPVQRQISSSLAHGKDSLKDKKQIRSSHPSLFLYAIITNRSHGAIHFKATKPCVFSTSAILLCFSQTPSKLWGYTEADISHHVMLSFKKQNGGKQGEEIGLKWTHWNCCIKLHFPADLWRSEIHWGLATPHWTANGCCMVHQEMYFRAVNVCIIYKFGNISIVSCFGQKSRD